VERSSCCNGLTVIRTRRPGDFKAPWWRREIAARGRMEAGIHLQHPGIKISKSAKKLSYELDLDVETYESHHVTIIFEADYLPSEVKVFADGPSESPHRYKDGSLCMWRRKDPPELRWLPKHGLVALIEMTRRHLFREAWWRETGGWDGGEWLGPETHPGEEDEEIMDKIGGAS
jgi:hypothetical protein